MVISWCEWSGVSNELTAIVIIDNHDNEIVEVAGERYMHISKKVKWEQNMKWNLSNVLGILLRNKVNWHGISWESIVYCRIRILQFYAA